MSKYILILAMVFLTSCYDKGDYKYIIYMSDGTKIKAWYVAPKEGCLSIYANYGDEHPYYLSPNKYDKVIFVGVSNDNKNN